ncbi:MAG: family 10 glycosylhydrolase [Prevotella sp.]|nr:family 10 glycosylhydrolase [Prevotella sp.]
MKKLLSALVLCAVALTTMAQVPKYEVRAVWLTTLNSLDWPSTKATNSQSIERQQQQLCAILDQLRQSNVNTVLFQTRVRATTIYPSRYEPFDGCLTGKPGRDPGYDVLRFAIDECHRRGMELHAWVVAIPVGKWNAIGCKQLRERYGSLIRKIGDEGYMNPEMSQTSEYIAKICREIAERYDVDGIHLDYIRYPENWKQTQSKSRGREHITRIVRSIHEQVKSIKPWVKISCSPVGKYSDLTRYPSRGWNAYDVVCQDAQGWLREGIMDQLYPMMYFKGDNFYPFAVDWADNTYGRTVAPGLAVWLLSRREGSDWPLTDITREMYVLRTLGMGHTYFRSRFFTDNTKGVYTHTKNRIDRYPALIPPMTWQSSVQPGRPSGMNIKPCVEGLDINWWGATDHSDAPYLMYNVYASDRYPVDISDARNLVATRLRNTHIIVKQEDGSHYYAVTAVDRYGNESAAIQSDEPYQKAVELLKNDGRRLELPDLNPTLNTDYISITSLAGNVITIRPSNEKYVSIRTIPDGVYTVNSVDRHKVSRRIGQFIIKRWGNE